MFKKTRNIDADVRTIASLLRRSLKYTGYEINPDVTPLYYHIRESLEYMSIDDYICETIDHESSYPNQNRTIRKKD